jgi:hypothetical protein
MDVCNIIDSPPGMILCIKKLTFNGDRLCMATLPIFAKPGSGSLRGQRIPLNGKEYLLKYEQVSVGTRAEGDNRRPAGILFSGFNQSFITGTAPDGSTTYQLRVDVAFNDERVSKSAGFRHCELDGRPLSVTGHVYLAERP